jgi:saccharopine dehydrogenase-like NADP-dependent oxidoreductase
VIARARRPVIAVIGGAGAMGRIIARDLAETAPGDIDLVIGERDVRAARRVAASLPRRVKVVEVDATDSAGVALALGDAAVIVNACHHTFNRGLMDAALALGAHYCDLGGLFHVTRLQLAQHAAFKRAGLLAVCGIGSAPGIVNVLARVAADRFDEVHGVHVAVGTIDRTRRDGQPLLDTSYSILTVLDEASSPAALYTCGRLRFVPPLIDEEVVQFPPPVGRQRAVCTLHSELATLPQSFRHKGVREVSFRIAFPGGLADRLRFVHALGLTSTEPIAIGDVRIVPRDVLLTMLAKAPRARATGPRDEHEVLQVRVSGRRGSRHVEEITNCHVPGMRAWDIGVDIDTGAPPSIVAQMLVRNQIGVRGVLPPERAVPPRPFLRALGARGMRITRRVRPVSGRLS